MQTRRFEFREGTSDKFWEVETAGVYAVIRYGRRGTEGSTQPKTFGGARAAESYAAKMIEEKVAKGYREVPIGNGSHRKVTAAQLAGQTPAAAAAPSNPIRTRSDGERGIIL